MAIAQSPKEEIVVIPRASWLALGSLCLGFFMIMVDSTIVSVASPVLISSLHAGIDSVVWVTSAFLLAYGVPLLFTGRLGDQLGPRNLYLAGLCVFTGASAACGFSRSIGMLIGARAVQGLGAALMTPQTMSVIARIFPSERRGAAMSVWGSVAGVALLVGPVLGGFLTDSLGWGWIFFINVPVGILDLVLAWSFVPRLPTTRQRFDLRGIFLSGVGMFALIFGIQQGQSYNWDWRTWSLVFAGILLLVAFVVSQARATCLQATTGPEAATTGSRAATRREPLLPVDVFSDRNFCLSNVAIAVVGFAVTGMALPLMLYAQDVEHLSPTRAALLLVPMAVIAAALAPVVGRMVDQRHPRYVAGFGLGAFTVALLWLALVIRPGLAIWDLLPPIALMGAGNAFIWSPISATATRNLSPERAGAASGVYNTCRQLGGVFGSATIGALMQSRLAANVAGLTGPIQSAARFALSMAQTLVLPGLVLVLGLVAVSFYANRTATGQVLPELVD